LRRRSRGCFVDGRGFQPRARFGGRRGAGRRNLSEGRSVQTDGVRWEEQGPARVDEIWVLEHAPVRKLPATVELPQVTPPKPITQVVLREPPQGIPLMDQAHERRW